MGFQEASGYCNYCKQQRLIKRKTASHIFHLLMSIITGGLWLIIWFMSSVQFGGWRCSQCGKKVSRLSSAPKEMDIDKINRQIGRISGERRKRKNPTGDEIFKQHNLKI